MVNTAPFHYQDYKEYLRAMSPRGRRAEMARALRCHPAFVSRVLNAGAHLSLEQAERLNGLLGHGELEARYFMLLVSEAKAGTASLAAFYRRERRAIAEAARNLEHRYRASSRPLPEVIAEGYYRQWYYAAIDLLIATGAAPDAASVARRLALPPERVERAIEQLVGWGLLTRDRQGKLAGAPHIHLPKSSPQIVRHHLNWRLKALAKLSDNPQDGVHYSGVLVLGREEAERLETEILGFIEKAVARAKSSPSEELYTLCVDFYAP